MWLQKVLARNRVHGCLAVEKSKRRILIHPGEKSINKLRNGETGESVQTEHIAKLSPGDRDQLLAGIVSQA